MAKISALPAVVSPTETLELAVNEAGVSKKVTALQLKNLGPAIHAASHQNAGADEISVAGLSGLLADAQTPAAHSHIIADVTSLQTTLDAKEVLASKDAANGYPGLDVSARLVLSRLVDIATASILGRSTAATGAIEVLTATQTTALLDAFTSTLKGLAPASGGGTTNFLRADGTWAAPSGGGGGPVTTKRVATQFDSTSATLAKVTALDATLAAGSYAFQYFIRYRSSDTTNGVKFNVNFSGTQTAIPFQWRWVDVSSTAATGAATQSDNTTGQVIGAFASRIARTTAAFGTTISVDVANADLLMIVEGIIEVTVSGDLQLYFGSEIAATGTQSIMVGSGLIVTKLG